GVAIARDRSVSVDDIGIDTACFEVSSNLNIAAKAAVATIDSESPGGVDFTSDGTISSGMEVPSDPRIAIVHTQAVIFINISSKRRVAVNTHVRIPVDVTIRPQIAGQLDVSTDHCIPVDVVDALGCQGSGEYPVATEVAVSVFQMELVSTRESP